MYVLSYFNRTISNVYFDIDYQVYDALIISNHGKTFPELRSTVLNAFPCVTQTWYLLLLSISYDFHGKIIPLLLVSKIIFRISLLSAQWYVPKDE